MSPPNLSLVLIMICFWITLWIVHRYLIRPVGDVLAERQGRIQGAEREWRSKHEEYLSATQRLETEIEEAAKESSRIRSELRQQAMEKRQATLEAARSTADERLQEAVDELSSEAGRARDELRSRARELARLFASQLLDREVAS